MRERATFVGDVETTLQLNLQIQHAPKPLVTSQSVIGGKSLTKYTCVFLQFKSPAITLITVFCSC